MRDAGSLSASERDWLKTRRNNTADALVDFFGHVDMHGFDAAGYIRQHKSNVSALPNVGIAVSGGGYRALLNGGGAVAAFDARTPNATSSGHLGGLLQSATYLSGLSGGGWLLGSLYLNNATTVPVLEMTSQVSDSSVWDFSQSILEGPKSKGIDVLNTVEYYHQIGDAADDKDSAGYEVSITDYWWDPPFFSYVINSAI